MEWLCVQSSAAVVQCTGSLHSHGNSKKFAGVELILEIVIIIILKGVLLGSVPASLEGGLVLKLKCTQSKVILPSVAKASRVIVSRIEIQVFRGGIRN